MEIKQIGCYKLNYRTGRQIFKPIAVVIHIMDGTLIGTDNWFQNPAAKVSAHYGVGTNGEYHQYVAEKDTAYHCGVVKDCTWKLLRPKLNPNLYTIGVEHESTGTWPDPLYSASVGLVAAICLRNNIAMDADHIVGHHEIYSGHTCPGAWDKQKYLDLLNVHKP